MAQNGQQLMVHLPPGSGKPVRVIGGNQHGAQAQWNGDAIPYQTGVDPETVAITYNWWWIGPVQNLVDRQQWKCSDFCGRRCSAEVRREIVWHPRLLECLCTGLQFRYAGWGVGLQTPLVDRAHGETAPRQALTRPSC